jgi:hypothetical protein
MTGMLVPRQLPNLTRAEATIAAGRVQVTALLGGHAS